MPSTRLIMDKLEQPIDEIEHFIHIRRQLEQLRTQFAIHMAANNERPLKNYIVPSQD